MPKSRKSARRKRVVKSRAIASIPRELTVPSEMMMIVRYCSVLNSTGTLLNHVFVANGLYDPDLSGIGHQPKGFDQMMALYERYDCLRSTIQVKLANTGTVPIVMVCLPKKDTSAATEVTGPIEAPFSVHALTGSKEANSLATVTNHVDIAKFTGRNRADLSYTGSASANPAQAVYWAVVLESVGGIDTHAAHWMVTIDYTVRFFNRKPLGAS